MQSIGVGDLGPVRSQIRPVTRKLNFLSLMFSFIWSSAEMESLKVQSKLSGIKRKDSLLSGNIESLNYEEIVFF